VIFAKFTVVVPLPAVVDAFERLVRPTLERVRTNLLESHPLAALRDTPLPKLISGELRVPDAGQLMEMAI
jgi:type I restriction enzyme S subunit